MLFRLHTSLAAAVGFTAALAGCGQKGPLTLPPAGAASAPVPAVSAPASSPGASLPAAPVPTSR